MKMKNLLMLLVCSISLGLFAQTKTIAGLKVPTTTIVNGKTLVLNGGGLREKYWIDLYVGSLYLENKSSDAGKIIYADDYQGIHIKIVSNSVTRDRFIETVKEGFERSTAGKATDEQIKKLISFFSQEIKSGDKILLEYIPSKGIVVTKNGDVKGTVGNLEFKKALFSIWLGSKPADETLKKGMLGKD
jgi:hypothetical protein